MKNTITLLLVAVLCCFGANASPQIITTIAGGDSTGLGDGGPAVDCELNAPIFVALDGFGDYYIADSYNFRIRKVNVAGIITTIAGTGTEGFSGDGGLATNAKVAYPSGLRFDRTGNLYFADNFNARIRKIDTAGVITTVAGPGVSGISGDGGPATGGNLFSPHDVVIDLNNNIYIADQGNACVRKVDAATGIITTVAGTWGVHGDTGDGGPATAAKFGEPYGIAIDATGNIYLADYGYQKVRKIDTFGIVTTIAGTGTLGYNGDNIPATAAQLSGPCGVAVDGEGNLYVADVYNGRLREVSASTGIISTVAGDGTIGYGGDGGSAILAEVRPTGVILDRAGNIYIADWGTNRIRFVKNTLWLKSLNTSQAAINIYPNPSDGVFNINVVSGNNESLQISISDVVGRMVNEFNTTTNQPLNVALDEPSGIYFLTVKTREGVSSRKIEVIR